MTTERFNAVVGADIKQFQRKMQAVDRKIKEMATGVDIDINAISEEFMAEMKAINRMVKNLDGKDVRIEIELAYKEFQRQLAQVYASAEKLDDYDIEVEIDGAINNFRRKLLQAKALAESLNGRNSTIDIKLNTSHFYRNYLKVVTAITALQAKDVWVKMKLKYSDFQQTMGRVASQMRNWGEIFSNMLMGSIISMIPLLSPLIASLVGLIGSLGVMVGVLAGQFLILGAAMGVTATAAAGFGAVAFPTIKKLFDETAKLNKEQQKARDSWDGLVAAYESLVAKTEGAVLVAFTYAMEGATKILQALEPMIVSTADAVVRLMDSFNRSIDTEPIQRIFETFNQFGASIFENVMRAIGNFIAGIGSLIGALTPAANTWSENFLAMSNSFADWAAGLSQSEKFQSFISYVQQYMPVISQLFADMVLGIVNFFSAFSGMGGDFMTSLADMMARFREWSSTLDENQGFQRFLNYIREVTPQVLSLIGSLIKFLVNVGVAMAPFATVVMDLTTKFLNWMSSMMETHSWFRNLIGILPILIGGFMALVAPIVMFITLFGTRLVGAIQLVMNIFKGLGGAVGRLLPHFGILWDDILRLMGGFGRFGGTITNLATKVLPLLGRAFTLLTGPVGLVIGIITTLITIGVWLYKNWDEVKFYAEKTWNAIAKFFSQIGSKIVDVIVNFFGDMWNGITGWLDNMYDSIANTWDKAISFLSSINLVTIGKDIIKGLINGIKSIDVLGSVKELGSNIVSGFKSFFKIKSPSRLMAAISKFIPQGVAKGILDNINVVKSAVSKLGSAVDLDFSKQVDKLSYGYRQMMVLSKNAYNSASKQGIVERYEAFEQALTDYKRFSQVTLAEEREYWLAAAKLTENNTAVKNTMLRKAADLQKQIQQEQYENEVYYLEKATKYQAMSIRQKIDAMQKYMKQYQVGSEQQIAYEEAIYDAKKGIYEDLSALTKSYLSDMESAYNTMLNKEKELRDAFAQTLQSRKDTLAKTWGEFDEVKLTEMVTFDENGNVSSKVDLLKNMRDQVTTMSNWMHDLFRLESFGLDEALIEELRNAGPKAAAEINALASMTSTDLLEYQKLWQTKMELAGKQATHELEKSRLEMEDEVAKLHINTAKEIEGMKNSMLKGIDEMINGSTDKFNFLTMTLPEIGKKAMEGLMNGLQSMEGKLQSTISKIASNAANSLQRIMQGINLTNDDLTSIISTSVSLNPSAMSSMELEERSTNVTLYQMWDGESVKTYLDEQDALNAKITVKKG